MKFTKHDFDLIKEAVNYYSTLQTQMLMNILTAEVNRSQEEIDNLYNNKLLPKLKDWWQLQEKLR